jgi:hypothetical protein
MKPAKLPRFSFLLEGGRPGWWCVHGDEAKVEVGADLSHLRQLSRHTTTQPSSLEEEGYLSITYRQPAKEKLGGSRQI